MSEQQAALTIEREAVLEKLVAETWDEEFRPSTQLVSLESLKSWTTNVMFFTAKKALALVEAERQRLLTEIAALKMAVQEQQRQVGALEAEVKSLRLKVPVTEAEAKAQYQVALAQREVTTFAENRPWYPLCGVERRSL